ncbi:hypothetical protein HDU93_007719 [Gonapodya sp. JEL0774]|nr:hypothetical protein HDU93_007719 [Gonapodya sp. JEL0774]
MSANTTLVISSELLEDVRRVVRTAFPTEQALSNAKYKDVLSAIRVFNPFFPMPRPTVNGDAGPSRSAQAAKQAEHSIDRSIPIVHSIDRATRLKVGMIAPSMVTNNLDTVSHTAENPVNTQWCNVASLPLQKQRDIDIARRADRLSVADGDVKPLPFTTSESPDVSTQFTAFIPILKPALAAIPTVHDASCPNTQIDQITADVCHKVSPNGSLNPPTNALIPRPVSFDYSGFTPVPSDLSDPVLRAIDEKTRMWHWNWPAMSSRLTLYAKEPGIPENIWKAIAFGQYVDLAQLWQSDANGGAQPNSANVITSLPIWLRAYGKLSRAMEFLFPELRDFRILPTYAESIVEIFETRGAFCWDSIYAYDIEHRKAVAANHSKSLLETDPVIFARILKPHTTATHQAPLIDAPPGGGPHRTKKAKSHGSSGAKASSGRTILSSVCNNWNSGRCTDGQCPKSRLHVCRTCFNADHRAINHPRGKPTVATDNQTFKVVT